MILIPISFQGPLQEPLAGAECRPGDQACTDSCVTVEEEKCETSYGQECKTVTDTKCEVGYEKKCDTEYRDQCR